MGLMLAYSRTVARRRCIVTLDTGRSFEGIVMARRGPLLVLRAAALVEPGRTTPIDGEVVVERHRIEFIQVVPGS